MDNSDPFLLVESIKKATPAIGSIIETLELTMLRQFFATWERLHSIKGDKRNPDIRAQHEAAAQELVETAHAIRSLKNGN